MYIVRGYVGGVKGQCGVNSGIFAELQVRSSPQLPHPQCEKSRPPAKKCRGRRDPRGRNSQTRSHGAATSLRQRLALGLRQEQQGHQADGEDAAHRHPRVAERQRRVRLARSRRRRTLVSRPSVERPDGRDEPADVVAERRAGAAQPRREQLGEVDGVAAEQRQLAEAHERDHPEDVADRAQAAGTPGPCWPSPADQEDGERRLAADVRSSAC